jgi:hypothetical protein
LILHDFTFFESDFGPTRFTDLPKFLRYETGDGGAQEHTLQWYDATRVRWVGSDPTDQTARSANNPVNVSARFITPQQVKLLSKFTSVGVNDVSSVL